MAGVNQVFSLADDVVRYVKACGKRSVLETKPLMRKVNIEGLQFAPNLACDTIQMSQSVGKHKIPRYLYHMTSMENYHKMLESGYIKPSGVRLPNGVYMLELDSFSKYWNKNMRDNLCDMVFSSGDSKNLVILKIPTENLTHSKIKIRTQKQVEGEFSNKADEWFSFPRMPSERRQLVQELISKYGKQEGLKRYLDIIPKELDPITKGIDAKLSPLYKQRKADIEFVYEETIPMSNIKKVGEFSYEKEFGKSYYTDQNRKNLCKIVFEKIFNGKAEEPFLKAWRE